MARSRELLLLPGLSIVALLFLAAAPGDAAAVRGCQAEVLAPTVALFCAPGIPAQWCCMALAHSATVGGGARCLCRLAAGERALLARAGLNGTDLLRLYAACAARGHGRGDGGDGAPSYPPAPSASTCDGGGAPTPADAPAPADSTGCDTAIMADEMELFCGRRSSAPPNPPCCEVVVASGRWGNDGVPCFCRVPLLSSSFDVGRISGLYHACGGSAYGPGVHLAGMCPPRPRDGNRV